MQINITILITKGNINYHYHYQGRIRTNQSFISFQIFTQNIVNFLQKKIICFLDLN